MLGGKKWKYTNYNTGGQRGFGMLHLGNRLDIYYPFEVLTAKMYRKGLVAVY